MNLKTKKNHIIISIDEEKSFDKSQHTLMIRVPGNEGLEGTYLNTVKAIYEPTTANITLNGQKLE